MEDRPLKSYIQEIEKTLDNGKGEGIYLNSYDLKKIKTILEQIKKNYGQA